ncbi:iron-sulfur cluster assembly scaffold protein [Acuticoccus sp. I52.16.1]|uniref:iron-sulfur cluster assembly scaffold protein n=1 Tax=Acuticoccus sp. I52.16.1 TaxID=2928472 RepID=UPI001FD0F8BD|nr:iron-sulfur cluster assembly scaffold protein [Acuticoccus sp. I52.16.1]UOM33760.1 iron-sulfur cluster assembly scaffold protein [Acuticoccus sp. I52.16.1]
MLSDLYNDKILGLAANIERLGRLDAPDASATHRSRLCGSQVTVDLTMKDGRVTDFAHDVKACALGQASSSIMARHVIGATVEELEAVHDQMEAMLKENGPPPTGDRWEELKYLEPVRDHKSRHASTMLTFGATLEAARKAADVAEAA